MRPLPWEDLDDWVARHLADRPPPVFQFRTPQEAVERFGQTAGILAFHLGQLGLRDAGRPVEESGVIEFDLDISMSAVDRGILEESLRMACREIDERAYIVNVSEEADERAVVVLEITSRIVQEEGAWDVIGPGGALTLFRRGEYLVGDLVVRQRIGVWPERGGWRLPTDVAQRVRALRTGSDVELMVDFGYFEASKYERQELLRPAYLLVVDRPQPEELGAGWRTVLVEPATSVPDLMPWAGLENWFEE